MPILDLPVRRKPVRNPVRTILGRAGVCCGALVMALAATVAMPAGDAAAGFERFWEEGDSARPQQRRSRSSSARESRESVYTTGKRRSRGLKRAARKNGYAQKRRRGRRVNVAALGKDDYSGYGYASPKARISGGGVRWAASSSCLNGALVSVINQVAANFGSVTVNSTCRSRRRNARVGGAHRSKHLTGDAVDFRVRGNVRAVHAFLRSNGSVGGLKHYGGGLFHIDTGARRSW